MTKPLCVAVPHRDPTGQLDPVGAMVLVATTDAKQLKRLRQDGWQRMPTYRLSAQLYAWTQAIPLDEPHRFLGYTPRKRRSS